MVETGRYTSPTLVHRREGREVRETRGEDVYVIARVELRDVRSRERVYPLILKNVRNDNIIPGLTVRAVQRITGINHLDLKVAIDRVTREECADCCQELIDRGVPLSPMITEDLGPLLVFHQDSRKKAS